MYCLCLCYGESSMVEEKHQNICFLSCKQDTVLLWSSWWGALSLFVQWTSYCVSSARESLCKMSSHLSKKTSWRRCQLWCRLPVSSTWLFSKNDKNVYGLFCSTNQTIYHLSKEEKWLIAKSMSHAWSALCALPTCRYGLMGWLGRWGVVQGWEGKCKIANLSFILTPQHLRPLWGWAMMSTSAWYRCLRQHCRPIAIKSDQAFYARQDYSVSILNLLLFCWNDIYRNGRRQENIALKFWVVSLDLFVKRWPLFFWEKWNLDEEGRCP